MKLKTLGVSPKLVAAIAAAVVSYLLTQTVLDLPPGVVLLLQVVSVAGAVWQASPGLVVAAQDRVPPDHTDKPDRTPIA